MNETFKKPGAEGYSLDTQVGFLLRRASQRHLSIFSEILGDLTPTQFAVLAKLSERGTLSQNALGRQTAMDAATVKGVVDRLVGRGLLVTARDDQDRRRTKVDLSDKGRDLYSNAEDRALKISQETLSPLDATDQAILLELLNRLC